MKEPDYRSCVLEPKLEELGYPHRDYKFCHREEEFKTYQGGGELDYLFFIDGIPALDIEAKRRESQFEECFKQASFYSRNYKPERTIPYILCAAGNILKMFKAITARTGVGVEFEELPRILTWDNLIAEIKNSLQSRTSEAIEKTTLGATQLENFFIEIFDTIAGSSRPRFKNEDEIVLIVNDIIYAILHSGNCDKIYKNKKFSKRVINRLEEILSWYDLRKIEGKTLAYAYREFVTYNFTGEGYGVVDKEIGRYLTPAPIIEFMVKLVNPKPPDKIIDFACGSGGFLGGIIGYFKNKTDVGKFLKNNLFAYDVDKFSVSTAKTFLDLLLPGKQEDLNIFHHNGLWEDKIHTWETEDLSNIIYPNTFDLVISNPPGGADYNLGYEDFIHQKFPLFSSKKKLENAPLFILRAIELCKNNGKICLITPDGVLANTNLQYFRDYILQYCQLKAIISLPMGIFPNVSSKMSIVYLVKMQKPGKDKQVFLEKVNIEEENNLESELNRIYNLWEKSKDGL